MIAPSAIQYTRDDVDYHKWYSEWMKALASANTRAVLVERLAQAKADSARNSAAHLRAIDATTSMSGQSQRRAQSRNAVAASCDLHIALAGAIEIHDLFPEHAKGDNE